MIIQLASLKGKRKSNEDAHIIFNNLDNINKSYSNTIVCGVFDGHGGKKVSKYLKSTYYKYFIGKYIEKELKDTIKTKKYFKKIHDHIQNKLLEQYKNMSYTIGSTSLVAVFYKHGNEIKYYISNVGDCRAVICNKQNQVKQLTIDHKPNSKTEKQRIEKLGGKIYFDGYDWRIKDLSVSRAFGDIDSQPYVTHMPDLYNYKLNSKDKFIIMACDGLWDVFNNQQAVKFVLKNMTKKKYGK